jgi:hypothetical protein
MPLWIPALEEAVAQVEREGRAIAAAYARNAPGQPPTVA